MRFKNVFDAEARKRRRLAKQALEDIRRLSAARFPIALLFDRMNAPNVQRQAGESWPEAFARSLGGLSLEQLRDYSAGLIETGLYVASDSDEKTPTSKDLVNYFRGAAALLLTTEQELAGRGE